MALNKINDDKGGFVMTWPIGDIEYVNPVEHYKKRNIQISIDLERELLKTKKPPFPISDLNDFFRERAERKWEGYYEEIKNTEIPKNLISLLSSKSKKEQVRLLKGASLTPFKLIGLIFHAFEKEGFLFSSYRAEHHHLGLDESQLPNFIHLKNDKVIKAGETSLTDGELKQVVNHRTVIVSKFIEKGTEWHCFFATYRSLKGEENWNNGQPHFHYISNKFGLTREKVLEELRSRHYKLNNLPHISLTEYNNEEE